MDAAVETFFLSFFLSSFLPFFFPLRLKKLPPWQFWMTSTILKSFLLLKFFHAFFSRTTSCHRRYENDDVRIVIVGAEQKESLFFFFFLYPKGRRCAAASSSFYPGVRRVGEPQGWSTGLGDITSGKENPQVNETSLFLSFFLSSPWREMRP